MNNDFYNGKYTLIVPQQTYEILTPSNVDLYIGNISKRYFDINKLLLIETCLPTKNNLLFIASLSTSSI